MADYLQFKRGKLAKLPATIVPGSVYITTDERGMYVDYNEDNTAKRLRIGDFVSVPDQAALNALDKTNLSTTAFYFVEDGNILTRYNGTGFTQINPNTIVKLASGSTTITDLANDAGVSVATTIKDTDGATATATFEIHGSAGAVVKKDGEAVKIEVNSINVDSHYTPTYDDTVDFKATDANKNVRVETTALETDPTVNELRKVRFVSGVNTDKNGHVVGLGYDIMADTHATINKTDLTVSAVTGGAKVTNNVTTSDDKDTPIANRGSFEIVGSGASTVTVNTDGKIEVSSTDQSVTEAEYHYDPIADASSKLTANGTNTPSKLATTSVVTAINRDAKGHIVSIDSTKVTDTHANVSKSEVTAAAGTGNAATIAIKVTDTDDVYTTTNTALDVKGDGATTVSVVDGDLIISSTDASVTSVGNHYTNDSFNATPVSEGAVIKGDAATYISAITLDAAGHIIGLKSKSITDTNAAPKSLVVGENETSGFDITYTDSNDKFAKGTIDPVITIGTNNTEVKFVDGVADLDVYTTTEVQNLITENLRAANAMTFVGNLDWDTTTETATLKASLPTADVNAGDLWIVSAAGTYGGKACNVGDMFIAYSDKDTNVTAADWAYVPAGNDEAPAITGADNKIQLGYKADADALGAIEVKGAEDCGVTATVANNVVTIGFEWGEF